MMSLRGVVPLVALLLALYCVAIGRQAFSGKFLSAVSFSSGDACYVELGPGFRHPGVHQISDGRLPATVISLTNLDCVSSDAIETLNSLVPEPGMFLQAECNNLNNIEISVSWMAAAKRMALGIPLHPDRMNLADWEALPGIGPRLAERIETDRQKNGDFGTLAALRRVSGIGPKRINDWQGYFSEPVSY